MVFSDPYTHEESELQVLKDRAIKNIKKFICGRKFLFLSKFVKKIYFLKRYILNVHFYVCGSIVRLIEEGMAHLLVF